MNISRSDEGTSDDLFEEGLEEFDSREFIRDLDFFKLGLDGHIKVRLRGRFVRHGFASSLRTHNRLRFRPLYILCPGLPCDPVDLICGIATWTVSSKRLFEVTRRKAKWRPKALYEKKEVKQGAPYVVEIRG